MERLRATWEGFNDREKRLVAIMGVVAAFIVVLMPIYLMESAIGEIEAESDEIGSVLRDIDRARDRLAEREAERRAAEARYEHRAPELGTFLEAKAGEQHLTLAQVTNQPEVQEGRFRRRHVRASIPGTDLRHAVRLLTEIENAPYPVALERIHVEHFTEGDRYNLEVGVITYDRSAATAEGATAGEGARSGGTPQPAGRAGPPSP